MSLQEQTPSEPLSMDFLTPEQRLEGVSQILATVALRIIQKRQAQEDQSSEEKFYDAQP